MNRRKKITFVYTLPTSFVIKDMKTLKSLGYKVFTISSTPFKNTILFLLNRIKEGVKGFFLIPRSSSVVIWFSDYHAIIPILIARAFSVKTIIMVGGYDAVSDSEINHGVFSKNNFRQKIAKINFNLATEIWVVDESLSKGCRNAFLQNKINSGLVNWIPEIEKKIKVVPTSYSSEFWKCATLKLSKTVLTVANLTDSRVISLKGIPLILKLAVQLPDFNFTIIGLSSEKIITQEKTPSNVVFLKPKNRINLKRYYSESQYYIQASRLEGLPNSLCEAMLCECIPIGNAVFGIPRAIGNSGLLFNGIKEVGKIKTFLRKNHGKLGKEARKHIMANFNEKKRIKDLRKI